MIKKVAVKGKASNTGVVIFESEISDKPIANKVYQVANEPLNFISITVTLPSGDDYIINSINGKTDRIEFLNAIYEELEQLGYISSWQFKGFSKPTWWPANYNIDKTETNFYAWSELAFKSAIISTEEGPIEIQFSVYEPIEF